MSTQLTISIELIAFMEWVLKYKRDHLNEFISHMIDDDLKEQIALITADREAALSSNDLYMTLNDFIRHMEECINEEVAQEELAQTCTRRSSKHRRHTHRCTRKSAINETETIKTSAQRTLYHALTRDESESSVH